MGNDKTALLHALVINRAEANAPAPTLQRARLWPIVAVSAAVVSLAALGIVWLLTATLPASDGAGGAVAQVGLGTASAQPAAPAADSRRGGLAASGYIVARRKATVAAEITGKVVEVMIEEGMVVDAGQ